jgi:hypothetical protein
MNVDVRKELATLERMPVRDLRLRFAEVFGEPTNTRHKDWLVKRIIWRMQAVAEGDLTERARRRAEELANDADLRFRPPKAPSTTPEPVQAPLGAPAPNGETRSPVQATVLTRVYKGKTLQVNVRPVGFEYEGEVYKSLSAVAKKITGSHCNGYLFFRLTKEGGER